MLNEGLVTYQHFDSRIPVAAIAPVLAKPADPIFGSVFRVPMVISLVDLWALS